VKIQFIKIAFIVAIGFAVSFAQEAAPEKLAVYVFGASDAGINKTLSGKLLVTMIQSGRYADITDHNSFHDELAKSGKSEIAYISQAAKRHGASYVCAVSMVEAFGAYSITARLVKISDSQVIKTGSIDRAIKSLEDLTTVSNELASQLLHSVAAAPSPPPPPVAEVAPIVPPAVVVPSPLANILAPVAAQKQCEKKYNINDLLFKIKEGFPHQLKDCSSKLAKDMLTPASLGGEKLEPKSYMTQCPIEVIKKELPKDFPYADKVLGSITNFVQSLMNSAIDSSTVDPKKLINAVANMNIGELLGEVGNLANYECVVDEPYMLPTPTQTPIAPVSAAVSPPPQNFEKNDYSDEESKSAVSFGIRAGLNLSHSYGEYNSKDYGSGNGDFGDIIGRQLGILLNITMNDWFYLQPGLMYIQKGRHEENKYEKSIDITAHYLELPLLFSLKFSAIRLNAGPYIGLCLSNNANDVFDHGFDIGLNLGLGFDIGKFYIGTFYDHGIADMSDKTGYKLYNRTLGFNLGVNL